MSKKTYEVTGNTPFMDYQPGDTFEAELDDDLEDRAIERGSIRVKRANHKKEETSDA